MASSLPKAEAPISDEVLSALFGRPGRARPSHDLEASHVGRREILDALTNGLVRLTRGERPLPLYLFGPHGIGRSHLVAIGKAKVLEHGVWVHTVPEDMAPPQTADELWAQMLSSGEMPPWLSWSSPPVTSSLTAPTVVFIEGLDRHLHALGEQGRKRLRGLLEANKSVWVVGTGLQLTDAFLARDEAFYGGFQVVALPFLTDPEAVELLERRANLGTRTQPRWAARRETAVTLSGGLPRALVTLADALAVGQTEPLDRLLLSVLEAATPHYRLRLRELPANEQRLLGLLTAAPRELGPTEVATRLGGHPSTWSTVAHRLVERGVLLIEQQGRSSHYRILEPLLRHWLEVRTAPPGRSRVAWLVPLLEHLPVPGAPMDGIDADFIELWEEITDQEGAASDAPYAALVEWLEGIPPERATAGLLRRYELLLGRVALVAPPRFEGLRVVLGARWRGLFVRTDVLLEQLAEGERSRLHPELARLHEVLSAGRT